MSNVTCDLWYNHLPIIGFMEIKCLVKSNEHQFIRMQITHVKFLNTVHQQQGHTFIATTQLNVSVMLWTGQWRRPPVSRGKCPPWRLRFPLRRQPGDRRLSSRRSWGPPGDRSWPPSVMRTRTSMTW